MARQSEIESPLEEAWKIIGLEAKGPLPDVEEKLTLFGQFVGEWDIVEARYPQPDGTEILEGKGVQDTFCMIGEKRGKIGPAGTTDRFYDPGIDAWSAG